MAIIAYRFLEGYFNNKLFIDCETKNFMLVQELT